MTLKGILQNCLNRRGSEKPVYFLGLRRVIRLFLLLFFCLNYDISQWSVLSNGRIYFQGFPCNAFILIVFCIETATALIRRCVTLFFLYVPVVKGYCRFWLANDIEYLTLSLASTSVILFFFGNLIISASSENLMSYWIKLIHGYVVFMNNGYTKGVHLVMQYGVLLETC